MAGTSTSGNKHSIPINPDGELGEAITDIILPTGFGSATFIMKEFMEKHKDELIDFWNRQGKDGNAIFEKWYAKWSIKKAEQDALNDQKEKEKHDKTVKKYVVLGRTEAEAEEWAKAFPDKDPCEVVRIRNYNTQTERPVQKENEEKQYSELQRLKVELADLEKSPPHTVEGWKHYNERKPQVVKRITEIEAQLKA